MVRTFHPICRKARRARRSRFLFARIFSDQNFFLVEGRRARRHPECPCQKHPFTKITTLECGITISGVPGSRRSWRRKRTPQCRRNRSTCFSGRVFVPLTRLISQLRFSLVRVSAISEIESLLPSRSVSLVQDTNNKMFGLVSLEAVAQRVFVRNSESPARPDTSPTPLPFSESCGPPVVLL